MDSVFRQQILVQLQVDGQQLIDDTKKRMDQLTASMVANVQQLQQGLISQKDYETATRGMAAEMVKLQDIINLGKKQLGDFESQMKGGAYAVLALSHAAQDFVQSGFPAVINNIPNITYGIGQLAGWSTQMSVAMSGVAMGIGLIGNTAWPMLKSFIVDMGLLKDHSRDFATSVDTLKVKLDSLTSRPFKVQMDYSMIEEAKRQIEELERRQQAFKSGMQSDVQGEAAKDAKEAVTVFGGGAGKVAQAVEMTMRAQGKDLVPKPLQTEIKAREEQLRNAIASGNPFAPMFQSQLEELKAKAEMEKEKKIQAEVGGFMLGDFGAIDEMQKRVKAFPQFFQDMQGPGGVGFGEFVTNMAGNAGEMRRRLDQEAEITDLEGKDAAQLGMFRKQQANKRQADAAAARAAEAQRRMLNDQGLAADAEMKAMMRAMGIDPASVKADDKQFFRDEMDRMNAEGMGLSLEEFREIKNGQAGEKLQADARAADVADMQRVAGNAGVDIFGAIGTLQGNLGMGVGSARAEQNTQRAILSALGQSGVRGRQAQQIADYLTRQASSSVFAGVTPDKGDMEAAFTSRGAAPAVAEGMAKRTTDLMEQGFGLMQSLSQSSNEFNARLERIEQQLMGVRNNMQRGRQRQPTLLNQFPPGVR